MVATHIGGVALAAVVALAGSAGTDTPGVPTSTVKAFGQNTAQYCVSGYAPNGAVSVHNERTGATASIETNNRGKGCTEIPVEVNCGETSAQTVVAAGVGADGNPATSSARAAVPANAPGCAANLAGDSKSVTTGLTGTSIVIIVLGGVAALALVALGAVLVRRRRSVEAE